MKEADNERMAAVLRGAIGPMRGHELQRDLWPEMLRRLDERPSQVPWLDWALAAVAGILLCFSPELIPVLLYHL